MVHDLALSIKHQPLTTHPIPRHQPLFLGFKPYSETTNPTGFRVEVWGLRV
jgi:hypothetical protein